MSGILYNPETGEVGGQFRYKKEKPGWTWLEYDLNSLPDVDNALLIYDGETVVLNSEAQTNVLWAEIRSQRNQLLSETDWTMRPDSPFTDFQKEEIISYCQALRDLPQTQDDPSNISWPLKPDFI